MRSKSKVPWWMMLALLLLLLDGTSAAPIPQSASELIADDGKTLAVGPGKSEDNAVFVVDDSNKLSFTLLRPSCVGTENVFKKVSSESSIGNSCKMNVNWIQIKLDSNP